MNLDEELSAMMGSNPYAAPQAPLVASIEATKQPEVLPLQLSLVAQGIKMLLWSLVFGCLGGLLIAGFGWWLKSMPASNNNLGDRMIIAAMAIMFPPILVIVSDIFQLLGNWRCSLTTQRKAAFLAKLSFMLSIPIFLCHLGSFVLNVIALNTKQSPGNLPNILELVSAGLGFIMLVVMIVYWKRTTAYLGETPPIKSCLRMIIAGLSCIFASLATFVLYWIFNERIFRTSLKEFVVFSGAGLTILMLVSFLVFYVLCLVQTRRVILRRMPTIDVV